MSWQQVGEAVMPQFVKISIGQQIEEVRRELDQRARVYPRLIDMKKLKRTHADYQTARLEAVLRTLEWLRDNQDKIKAMSGDREDAA